MKYSSLFAICLISSILCAQHSYLDSNFGDNGSLVLNITSNDDEAADMYVQDDGSIILLGYTKVNGDNKPFLKRVLPNGQVDSTFRKDELFLKDAPLFNEFAKRVLVQNDGKIVVATNAFSPFGARSYVLRRLMPDGSDDLEFGINGMSLEYNHSNNLLDIVLLEDESILCVGTSSNDIDIEGSNGNLVLSRFSKDGLRDREFGDNGHLIIKIDGLFQFLTTNVALDKEGKLIVIGVTNRVFGREYSMLRLSPEGVLDSTFGINGEVKLDFGSGSEFYNNILFDQDDNILITGEIQISGATNRTFLSKFNAVGELLESEFEDGIYWDNRDERLNSIFALEDEQNQIYLLGQSYAFNDGVFAFINRYHESGNPDLNFGQLGTAKFEYEGRRDAFISAKIVGNKLLCFGIVEREDNNSDLVLSSVDLGLVKDYQPLSNISHWKIRVSGLVGSSEFWYEHISDTIINNRTYKVIASDQDTHHYQLGYLREDIEQRKVYTYRPNQDREYLYYDFNLEVGDAFETDLYNGYVVTNKEIVNTENGPVYRWSLEGGGWPYSYTEGLGSPGLFENPGWSDPVYALLCAYDTCQKIYCIDDNCFNPDKFSNALTIDTTLCLGDEFMGYSEEGQFIVRKENQDINACDTVFTLNLTILEGVEIPYNGIDDDCDDLTPDDDLDQDGYFVEEDCDDNNFDVNPGQLEIPYNGMDDDCDLLTLDDDLDQDGYLAEDDCDDDNAAINPGAEEIPNNGTDEDCDGSDFISGTYFIDNTQFSIYPNPSSDYIFIDTDKEKSFDVKLYDLQGRIIQSHSSTSRIDVSTLEAGAYILEVKVRKANARITELIVVSK